MLRQLTKPAGQIGKYPQTVATLLLCNPCCRRALPVWLNRFDQALTILSNRGQNLPNLAERSSGQSPIC